MEERGQLVWFNPPGGRNEQPAVDHPLHSKKACHRRERCSAYGQQYMRGAGRAVLRTPLPPLPGTLFHAVHKPHGDDNSQPEQRRAMQHGTVHLLLPGRKAVTPERQEDAVNLCKKSMVQCCAPGDGNVSRAQGINVHNAGGGVEG